METMLQKKNGRLPPGAASAGGWMGRGAGPYRRGRRSVAPGGEARWGARASRDGVRGVRPVLPWAQAAIHAGAIEGRDRIGGFTRDAGHVAGRGDLLVDRARAHAGRGAADGI